MESVCRACLNHGKDYVSMTESVLGEDTYAQMLNLLSGEEIEPEGELPRHLCANCAKIIRRLSRFRILVRKSQHILQSGAIKRENRADTSDDEPIEATDSNNCGFERLQVKDEQHRNVFKCGICGLCARTWFAMRVHHRSHTGEKPHICHYCGSRYTQKGSLTEHVRRKHSEPIGERLFTCDVCGKLFARKNALIMHMRIHTKEKPFKCSYCSRRFNQRGVLMQHERLHTGERPYSCHACPKKFIAKTTLIRHLTVHSNEKNFKCEICDKAVKSSSTLRKHVKFVHGSEKLEICAECGARFSTKHSLSAHVKNRHSESSGSCSICLKQFSNISDHMRTHTGVTPFRCDICDKAFAQKRNLTAHLNKHANSDKYPCETPGCSATFSMKCKLEFHTLKVHSDVFPYVCDCCSKGFYRKCDLSKHTRNTHRPD